MPPKLESDLDEQEPQSVIRKILPFTTVGVIIAVLYVGYIFYSRWSENRDLAAKQKQEEAMNARKTVDAYGGGQVKVLSFSLSAGAIHPGDTIKVCYGVSNAKTVTIEPKPEGEVWPSLSRCVDAAPKKDTTYTITADDGQGHTDTQSLAVKVVR